MYIYYKKADARIDRDKSRELLATALAAYIENQAEQSVCDEHALISSIKRNKNGKPYFDMEGAPHFSISHSLDTWAVLIGEEECGLDIQYPKTTNYDGIAGRHFSKKRAELIRSLTGEAKEREFFDAWTEREALVKALGLTVFTEELPADGYDIKHINLGKMQNLYCAVAVPRSVADEEIVVTELL